MNGFTPEFLLQVMIAIGTPTAVYAAIRADLREAMVRAQAAAETAEGAHRRIDAMLGEQSRHGNG